MAGRLLYVLLVMPAVFPLSGTAQIAIKDIYLTNTCFPGPATCFDPIVLTTGSPVVSWYWEFGDPASGALNFSNQNLPCHQYPAPGSYTTRLGITCANGDTDTMLLPVTISNLPVAAFADSSSGSSVWYKDQSSSSNGQVVSWSWTFPSGVPDTSTFKNPPSVTYPASGSYTVCLTVISSVNCTTSFCKTINLLANNVTSDLKAKRLPFPFSDHTTIDLSGVVPGYAKNLHLKLYDAFGVEVTTVRDISDSSFMLKREFPPGIYFFRVFAGIEVVTSGKIVAVD